MKKYILLGFLLFLSVSLGYAQDSLPNTMRIDSTMASPPATLQDIAWIQGHWQGEAFGGIVEEVWTPPLGGSMMCAFKLVVNNEVRFYELVTISEEENTLMLRLKHFHKDLKGWEEKNETVDFPLVKVTPGKVFFDGFTFERISENEMNIYVIIGEEGKEQETKFNYKRVLQG
ncbi:MAG: DUF6265 family protein [Candidatus Halalkalibacterium sp. M3_1C_030]